MRETRGKCGQWQIHALQVTCVKELSAHSHLSKAFYETRSEIAI